MRLVLLAPALALVPALLLSPGERTRTPAAPAMVAPAQLAFEPAAGRFGDDVSFVARSRGMTLFVGSQGSAIALGGKQRAVVRTELAGARTARTSGSTRLPGVVNSYVGPRSSWRTGLPTFGQVTTNGVYPGIDLAYHGRGGRLEYDFHVAPGADPAQIAMRIRGGRSLRLDKRGDLVIRTTAGPLRQLKPIAFQGHKRVAAHFAIDGDKVGFELGAYDSRKPLVIDPELAYSSYLGGTGDEYSAGMAVDGAGSIYIATSTDSADFPASGSLHGFDGTLTKISADGKTRLYSTYFGGSGTDSPYGVAVDSQGNAFLGGVTQSGDLPGRTGGQQASPPGNGDGFVAKFDASGALVQSTYLGGSAYDVLMAIAVDSSGNPYVTGETYSTNFPTTPGTPMQGAKGSNDNVLSDGFITKLTPTLTGRSYSTYLGGQYDDYGKAIAIGSDGTAYVTGYTTSPNFPLTNADDTLIWSDPDHAMPVPPPADAFITRLSANGSSRVYSTYLGGNGFDQGNAIAVDGSGNALMTGDSSSNGGADNFPGGGFPYAGPAGPNGGNAGGTDALIAKLSPTGSRLFAWWYGGSQGDSGMATAFDQQGNAYFGGRTASSNLPTSNGVPQSQIANAATEDGWVMKLDTHDALTYGTYLGGSGYDAVTGMSVDSRGSAYLVGDTTSNNFPVDASPMQIDNAGGADAWFAKLVISRASITSGPEGTLRSRDASFTYTSNESNATLNCRLSPMESAFTKCPRSGKSYTGLADGPYTFEVATTDFAGTTSDPVSRNFTVDTRPIADFSIAPNPALAGRTVTFDAAASAGAGIALTKFEWDLDGDGSFERDTGTTTSTNAVYPSPTTLKITLRVTDAESKTATVTKELRVTVPPTSTQFGVSINKGARWTNTPDVVVAANFPATTTSLLFSNDGGFLAPTEFVPKPTIKWRLDSSGPERLPKTIYVRFLAGAFVSETHQDDIILDETPPKVEQAVVAPAAGPAGARVVRAAKLRKWKLRVKATDKNSGVGRIQATSNKKKPGKLLTYKRRLTVKSAQRPRWVRARDRAGNFSKWRRARG
ncbi:MAG TPA: SBBP repeat-containing protein [Thermoleophilaceae bacterium]